MLPNFQAKLQPSLAKRESRETASSVAHLSFFDRRCCALLPVTKKLSETLCFSETFWFEVIPKSKTFQVPLSTTYAKA